MFKALKKCLGLGFNLNSFTKVSIFSKKKLQHNIDYPHVFEYSKSLINFLHEKIKILSMKDQYFIKLVKYRIYNDS